MYAAHGIIHTLKTTPGSSLQRRGARCAAGAAEISGRAVPTRGGRCGRPTGAQPAPPSLAQPLDAGHWLPARAVAAAGSSGAMGARAARPSRGVLLAAALLGAALLCGGARAARQAAAFDDDMLTRMIRGVHEEIEEDPAGTAAEAASEFLQRLGSGGSSSSRSRSSGRASIRSSSSSSSSIRSSSSAGGRRDSRVVARAEARLQDAEASADAAEGAHKHLKKRRGAFRGDASYQEGSAGADKQQPEAPSKDKEQEKREREWSYWYGDGPNRGLADGGGGGGDKAGDKQPPPKGADKGGADDKVYDDPNRDPYSDPDGRDTIKAPGYGNGWLTTPDVPVPGEQPATPGVTVGGCRPGVVVSSVMGSAVVLDNSIEVSKTPYKATADCMGEPKNVFQYGGACELTCTEPEDYGTLFNSFTSFTTGTEAQTVCGTLRFSKQELKGICSLIPIAHCCEPVTASTS